MQIKDDITGIKYEVRIERDPEHQDYVLLDIEELDGEGWIILPLSVTQAKMVAEALRAVAYDIVNEHVRAERETLLRAFGEGEDE